MTIPRIDSTVKSFVMKLNRIKGIYPASSCGGHDKPKGSRQPRGEFFVIMKIWNPNFLKGIIDLCEELEDFCRLEYSDLHESWCLAGFVEAKDIAFEPFVDEFLSDVENTKPQGEWEIFYSYCAFPRDTNGMSNSSTLTSLSDDVKKWFKIRT